MYPSNGSQYPCIDHALKQCGDEILEHRHMDDVETCFSIFFQHGPDSETPSENIVQKHLNIALLNVY